MIFVGLFKRGFKIANLVQEYHFRLRYRVLYLKLLKIWNLENIKTNKPYLLIL